MAQRTVSGTVLDSDNDEPLIGATVLVSGTSSGTITDFDGNFSVDVPEGATTLEISYTGYATKTMEIGASNVMNITLAPGTVLDEVVVVGYGTQKAKEVTSAVTSVKAEDFNQGNINDPAQLLQGKVAGLTIARPGGDPNGEFNIRLRGLSTIGANSSPLIVIDGVPNADLNIVDPQDIQSIDVLKDGAAAAIYGTQASSGVILITTKQGSAGNAKVGYNGYVTVEDVAETVDVADGALFSDLGGNDLGSRTDWFDEITRTAVTHVHNLSLSGGNAKTSYRLSFNFRDAQGVGEGTGFEQLNGRLNLTQRALNDRLKVTFGLAATNRNAELGFNEAFRYATTYNPTAPIRNEDGTINELGGFDNFNPVGIVEQTRNVRERKQINVSIRGDYELVEGWTASVFYAQQYDNQLNGKFYSKDALFRGQGRNGRAVRNTDDKYNQLIEVTSNYEKTFGKLGFKALAGYSFQEFTDEFFEIDGGNFVSDELTFNNFEAAFDFLNGLGDAKSNKERSTIIGFFGRLNFNWDDTYFLTASVRQEGSSRLGDNNKWGTFPAVSAGVVLSNLMDVSGLDNLKLRAGFGVTGNLPGKPYQSIARVRRVGSYYNNGTFLPAYGSASNPNPDLKWETKNEFGVGLDFAFMDYKLTGSIDYYNRQTKDLILELAVAVPPNPFPTTFVNVGELENQGLEIALSYMAVENEKITWQPSVTFSTFSTELKSFSDEAAAGEERLISNLGAPGQNGTFLIRVKEGEPVGQIWGPQFLGINDDGTYNLSEEDQVLGNGLPDFEIGFNNSLTFGKFDLNFFLRGALGHDLVNTYRAFYESPAALENYNVMASTADFIDVEDAATFSSLHVENGSFIKLDNMTLGYNFDLPDNSAFSQIRVYASGQNLFVISDYSGVDPEVRFTDPGPSDNGEEEENTIDGKTPDPLAPGIDRRNTWFRTRAFTFGVTLGF